MTCTLRGASEERGHRTSCNLIESSRKIPLFQHYLPFSPALSNREQPHRSLRYHDPFGITIHRQRDHPLRPPSRPCSRSNIIGIDQINSLIPQLFPNPIPQTDWPSRLIPIPQQDSFRMRYRHLRSQSRQLAGVE